MRSAAWVILLISLNLLVACRSAVRYGTATENDSGGQRNEAPLRESTGPERGGAMQRGMASYYADKFHGRQTANGEVFDMNAMTAAHRNLPFNTRVHVVNLNNGKEVIVRINDRGPFVEGRIIDLSKAAAQALDMMHAGVVPVELTILD